MEETCAARCAASAKKKMKVGASKKIRGANDDDIETPLVVE